jgi:hypothetical protein
MIGEDDLRNRFTYHPPTVTQTGLYEEIRERALNLGLWLDEVLPDSREKSLAFTALDDMVMSANASIARHS